MGVTWAPTPPITLRARMPTQTTNQARAFARLDRDAASNAVQRRANGHDVSGQLAHNAQFKAQMIAQMRGQDPEADTSAVLASAAQGVEGSGGALPYLDTIQKSFGHHNVGSVQAFVGGQAKAASDAIGAEAYATGNSVAFRGSPTLHTAAHEAAHIVQQRAGVQLSGGVGQVGDKYECHADAVADRVVQGKSAADLLDQFTGVKAPAEGVQRKEAVQRFSNGETSVEANFVAPPYLGKKSLKRHAEITSVLKSAKRLGPAIVIAAAILAATSSPEDYFVTQSAGVAMGGGTPYSSEAEAIRSIHPITKEKLGNLVGEMKLDSTLSAEEQAYWSQVWNRFDL
ncbi:MAG: hypothetical protein ACI9U2_003256 [Bradymonadia bacterium]|jgi:hypothetical protein